MRKIFFLSIVTFVTVLAQAANWSFAGGTMYFDNSTTGWSEAKMMLVIGHSGWSAVYEMSETGKADLWSVEMPSSWDGAQYMAVMNHSALVESGGWGSTQLSSKATHYSAAYIGGIEDKGLNYIFTPQNSGNGCSLALGEIKKEIRLVPGVWTADGAKFAAWSWKSGKNGVWTNFTGEGDTVTAEINTAADHIQFLRLNPAKEPGWDAKWDNIDNIEIDWTSALYVITDWAAGYWKENITPEPEPEPKFKWSVAGDFDDWHAEMLDEKIEGAENTLYLSKYLPAGKELAFKVLQGADTWYSANGVMSQHHHENWGFSTYEIKNCRLATTIAGYYEFAFDTINAKMTVSYPYNAKQATLYDSPVKNNNTDVMLQAFYWAHDNDGNDITTFGNVRWAALNAEADEIAANFDLVWLAPSQETADYTGYLPMNYSKQGVAQDYSGHHGHAPWGTASDLRNLIDNLHQGGAKVVADIVLNHTCAGHVDEYEGEDKNWCSWELNDFGRYGQFQIDRTWITAEDEMFATDYQYGRIDRGATGDCGDYNTALLTPDEKTVSYLFGTFDWAYSEYNSTYSRDLAHGKKEVQEMSRAYLTWMRDSIGYDGFRFDFMKGIAGWHLAEYNNITAPYFCVAEVFDGNIDKQLGFLYDAQNTTYLFDFPGKFTYYNAAIREYDLKNLKSDYSLIRRNPKHTVTFIDNHDSFNENGKSLYGDANKIDDRQVHQALAFQLSMPGVPCVFYPYWHFYKDVCNAFIHARKAAGVHSESTILGEWAGSGAEGDNYYTALIQGTKGQLFVKLGYDCVPTDAPMAEAPEGQKWVCAWANREHAGVWYTVDSDAPTGTENTESAAPVTKIIRDGQIFIQRGDQLYTPQGARVK